MPAHESSDPHDIGTAAAPGSTPASATSPASADSPASAASPEPLPAHLIEAAGAIRALGSAFQGREPSPAQCAQIAAVLGPLTDQLMSLPMISKAENLGRRNRINHFISTGTWPPAPPDHSVIEFDPTSVVGGELNPFSMGAVYTKEGNEAVGRVTLSRCFEGPPERAHGGMICALFDEVMGSVFRATGTASAFTGELTVRFLAPAPLSEPLEFRARLARSDGRRRYMEAEAHSAEGQFAKATAVFVEMKPEHFTSIPE